MDYQETLNIFRFNLRLLRTSHCLSGDELGGFLGMGPKRINDIEDRTPPKLEDIVAIVAYFKVPFDTLLSKKITLNI